MTLKVLQVKFAGQKKPKKVFRLRVAPEGKRFTIQETYPKFAFKIESIQQFDNVMMIAGGQNVDLHHVILQFILRLGVNNLSSGKCPILLVLCLEAT